MSFNGRSFDLPVLRYRAMVNEITAPGLFARKYFYRYSDDALDLCDELSSFEGRSKVKLDELCRILKLAGSFRGPYFRRRRLLRDRCREHISGLAKVSVVPG